MMPYLWKRIRFARLQAKLSQTQIADACGVSQVAVVYWEKPPTATHANELGIEALQTIAQLTHTPVEWFFKAGDPDNVELTSASNFPCITLEDVEAESVYANQLAIMTVGPNGEQYREPLVSAYRLHLALGISTPYQQWLEEIRKSCPFGDQDYQWVTNGDTSTFYWHMDAAKSLALRAGTARGFAIWRMLIRLNNQYRDPAVPLNVQPESPAASIVVKVPELTVSPCEFVDVVSGCVKLAHQMGLHGERAQQAADQAATRLTGWSVRELMGIAA